MAPGPRDKTFPEHAWSQATSEFTGVPGSRTKVCDRAVSNLNSNKKEFGAFAAAAGQTAVLVPVDEAELIIASLKSFAVEEIGSSEFMRMYGHDVERLSMQAHATAQYEDGDEFVVEAVLTLNKLPELVRTLLAVEAWRCFVLGPRSQSESALAPLLAEHGNALRCGFALHVETTLVGLLNLILYRRESCGEIDSDTAVALVDYCARQLTSLAVPVVANKMVRRQKDPETSTQLAKRLQSRSALDEIKDTCLETQFKTAVAAVALARYLCEHIQFLPLGVQTRILDTHDFLVLFVPLVDEPPWTRRRKVTVKQTVEGTTPSKTIWEKIIDNQWVHVPPADLLQITKCEAQCWLAIFHLTCSDLCRERYALNTFRKEQLLRLRKFLNDVVLDQLPVLADVMRYMDELALMYVPETSTGQGSALLMQQVAVMRDSLIRGRDWAFVAQQQFEDIFSKVTDAQDLELREIATIYSEDRIADIVGEAKAFEPTAQRLGGLTLSLDTGDMAIDTFSLTCKDNGAIVQTPHGPFRRTKLSIFRVNDDGGETCIPSCCQIVATAVFENVPDFSVKLTCSNVDLPYQVSDAAIEGVDLVSSRFSTKEWRQLGTLEEKLVLQLGFKISSSASIGNKSKSLCYTLDQAYLSQPAPNP